MPRPREGPQWEARVLQSFVAGGRVVRLPARRKKRMVVLGWLAGFFRPGERYPEAQLTELLGRHVDDATTVRRLLVDGELMQRDRGLYWRAGTLPPLRPPAARPEPWPPA